MSEQYDVAIIGAGHNGLVAANYLARAGCKVIVLEARYKVGGACVSEELIPGATFSQRITRLRHAATTEWFTLAWLAALIVLGISRLVQLGGLVLGVRQKDTRGPILFLFFVALYFLAVNGPIGYAKYRLPMEPTLIVLLVAGLAGLGLLDRIRRAVIRLRHSEM